MVLQVRVRSLRANCGAEENSANLSEVRRSRTQRSTYEAWQLVTRTLLCANPMNRSPTLSREPFRFTWGQTPSSAQRSVAPQYCPTASGYVWWNSSVSDPCAEAWACIASTKRAAKVPRIAPVQVARRRSCLIQASLVIEIDKTVEI